MMKESKEKTPFETLLQEGFSIIEKLIKSENRQQPTTLLLKIHKDFSDIKRLAYENPPSQNSELFKQVQSFIKNLKNKISDISNMQEGIKDLANHYEKEMAQINKLKPMAEELEGEVNQFYSSPSSQNQSTQQKSTESTEIKSKLNNLNNLYREYDQYKQPAKNTDKENAPNLNQVPTQKSSEPVKPEWKKRFFKRGTQGKEESPKKSSTTQMGQQTRHFAEQAKKLNPEKSSNQEEPSDQHQQKLGKK